MHKLYASLHSFNDLNYNENGKNAVGNQNLQYRALKRALSNWEASQSMVSKSKYVLKIEQEKSELKNISGWNKYIQDMFSYDKNTRMIVQDEQT